MSKFLKSLFFLVTISIASACGVLVLAYLYDIGSKVHYKISFKDQIELQIKELVKNECLK